MGFFDKLFGGKAAETKFKGEKMTVMMPLEARSSRWKSCRMRPLLRRSLAAAAASSPPAIPCMLRSTAL